MINIVICEDEEFQREQLEHIIQKCIEDEELLFQIYLSTGKISDIMDYIENRTHNHTIFFLDINLKSNILDGIELGNLIRKSNIKCDLVYLTAYAEKAVLTYENELDCVDFIIKTDDIEKIKARAKIDLLKIQNRCARALGDSEVFLFNNHIVNPDKITYIETSTSNHKIIIHYENDYAELRGNLMKIADSLPEYFFRCHRCIIANINKITRIDISKRKIYFFNNSSCDGSLRLLRSLKKVMGSEGK